MSVCDPGLLDVLEELGDPSAIVAVRLLGGLQFVVPGDGALLPGLELVLVGGLPSPLVVDVAQLVPQQPLVLGHAEGRHLSFGRQ